jgi:hypothetical protein
MIGRNYLFFVFSVVRFAEVSDDDSMNRGDDQAPAGKRPGRQISGNLFLTSFRWRIIISARTANAGARIIIKRTEDHMDTNVRLRLKPGLIAVGLAVLCSIGWHLPASGATRVLSGTPKIKQIKIINANAWTIKTTNYGPIVFPESPGSGGFWGGPGYNYIYGGGMWVGALDTLDAAHVSAAYHPNSGASEMGPANPYTWDWTNWASDSVSRMYLSTDPADLAAWPLRDAGNNPVVKSIQDGYATYSDQNPAFTFTGESPVGVRVRQSSYAWNTGSNNDVVYFRFTVINASGDSLRNVYAGPCFDADIGDESGSLANDRTDFDYTRNLAIQYQTDPEPGWPSVGQFGCRYFESPLNNTGDTVHVVDNQFSHNIAPGAPLGLTAFKIFTISIDPATDPDRYSVMQGYDYTTMVMDAYDETGSTTPGDKRFVMCSGPFNLAVGDSVIIATAVMAAANRSALLALSDSAQEFYDNGMAVEGGPGEPRAPEMTVLSQSSPNPFTSTTMLAYALARPSAVSLRVYNTAGQLVRTLVNGRQGAGTHSVRWDGRNDAGRKLPAGAYLYRLQAGDRTMTRKLVLVK